jgi:hypothetical protein
MKNIQIEYIRLHFGAIVDPFWNTPEIWVPLWGEISVVGTLGIYEVLCGEWTV